MINTDDVRADAQTARGNISGEVSSLIRLTLLMAQELDAARAENQRLLRRLSDLVCDGDEP
jgi:hypothetical protein